MKSKKIFLIVFLFFISKIVISQNCSYSFTGIVEDFHDKTALIGATLHIKNLNKYASTDIEGKFEINNLCAGKLIIEVSHLACNSLTFELAITGNIYKVIDLEHHIEELDEISIKVAQGKKTTTAQETLLKEKQIDTYSDASLGDALKEVSGVSSVNTGNSIVKPVINGLHSSRVLIYSNGVRLQDQEWGIEHAPNVDINAAGSISVIKGANALEYGGDAIGGIVLLNPSKVYKKDTLVGKTIVSQQSNGLLASLSTSLNKSFKNGWFINGQASIKRSGDFQAANYNLTNTGIDTKGFSLDLGFKEFGKGFDLYYSFLSNELGILRASHIGNASDLVEAINSPDPLIVEDFSHDINNPKQKIKHHLFKTKFYKRFKGLGKLSLQYDFQHNERLEFDIRRGGRSNIPGLDLTLQTHLLKTDMLFDANENNIYKVGINGSYQNNFPDPDTGVRRFIPDYDKLSFGTYVTFEKKFTNNLTLNAGIRYDYNHINAKKFYLTSSWENYNYNEDFSDIILYETDRSQYLTNPIFNYHNISASIGTAYDFSIYDTFIFNIGLANRPPNPAELFSDGLHHSAARFEIGDLRITPENSIRPSATYMHKGEKLSFTGEAFINYVKNYIFMEPVGFIYSIRGDFPLWNYMQTDALLFGFDTDTSFRFNKNFTFTNSLSIIKGKDITNEEPLIDMPPFKTTNTITYKNNQWNNFYASIESQFNARQNEFPNNNFTTYIASTGTYEPVDVSTPPDAYHLLNFSTGFDMNLSETKINVNFTVNNLLNTSYRDYLNQLRYFADNLGRNFKIQLKINY